LRLGGIAALATTAIEDALGSYSDDSATLENNKNYGTIRNLASTFAGDVMCVGGVVGEANLPISNCYNYHSGSDEKSADIYVGGTLAPATVAGIAGIVGSTTADTNDIHNVHNYGNIELHYTLSTNGQPIYQAGLVARAHGDVGNSANHGNLLIAVDCSQVTSGTLTYAGCIDYAGSGKLTNLTNKGEVRYTGRTSYRVKFGGIARYVDGSSATAMENCVNDGDLIYAGLSVNTAYVGGLVQDCDMSMTNCHNNGDIVFDQRGAVSGSAQVAGLMDAISGSTNATMHLPAIAHEFGIDISAETFDRMHRGAHYLLNIRPSGDWPAQWFYYAGGVPRVMEEIRSELHLDVLTVTGKTLGENLDDLKASGYYDHCDELLARNAAKLGRSVSRTDIIHSFDDAKGTDGSIAILKGNIAPEGCVIKHTACPPAMLKATLTARRGDKDEALGVTEAHVPAGLVDVEGHTLRAHQLEIGV
jgi:hypothetical protein